MDSVVQIFEMDAALFQWVNQGLSNAFFDAILPHFRNKYFWIWLYIILIALAFKKDKKSWIMLLLAALIVFMCDGISAGIIKPYVMRIRPCNDPNMQGGLNLLVPCGSGYSFVSAHAANHFGLAMLFGGYFSRWFPKIRVYALSITWAFLIAFAQVYVGVHYPFDVIFGALIGILIGGWIWKIFKPVFRESQP
jgi:undecaprenyl-diphosphatase